MHLGIISINPTIRLRRRNGVLQQQITFTIKNDAESPGDCLIHVRPNGGTAESLVLTCGPGETAGEVYLDERDAPTELAVELVYKEEVVDRVDCEWKKPKRWVVHVVQLSHHDVGYTDLPSNVLNTMDTYLDEVIEHVQRSTSHPDDSQFRVVVEQAWSIEHYLRGADRARADRMVDLIKSGFVEVTALFGNMTTELCGHESLVRAVYPAYRLARRHGFSISTAEHNDVPGFSWGLATVLTEAGIRLFCPGLPLYYGWGENNQPSFWDQGAIFGYNGPGVFRWEAPNGKRLLVWCNNWGCGGGSRASFDDIPDRLQALDDDGYPYSVIRWPVQGGMRDNSPYIGEYSLAIRDWNERWEFPHLVSSTNSLFLADLEKALPPELPVHRGELPGQDYPVGALSTSEGTSVNRRNHPAFLSAERAALVSQIATGTSFGRETLNHAMADMLWYDEHTWGFNFPAGPAQRASELEKAVHAHRAAALIQDASAKNLAAVADQAKVPQDGLYLLVFNPLPFDRSGIVRAPLHEMKNCGSTMMRVAAEDDPEGVGYLVGASLGDRNHEYASAKVLSGEFRLIDQKSSSPVEFTIEEISDRMSPRPYAAARLGLGSGGNRLAVLEDPKGLVGDLVFRADNVPSLGYRIYQLAEVTEKPSQVRAGKNGLSLAKKSMENEYFRMEFDDASGEILSIIDKESDREIIDTASPYHFADVLVRKPDELEAGGGRGPALVDCSKNALSVALSRELSTEGHPSVRQELRLHTGMKCIELSMRIVKDPTPLLEVFCAFPFLVENPRFRYEGVLSTIEYMEDYLPGAYGDFVTFQNWLSILGSGGRVFVSSLDSPIAALGTLSPGRISPAHSCVVNPEKIHPVQRADEIKHGWVFSALFMNNFGTNFSPYQSGDFTFRYLISCGSPGEDDTEAIEFGQSSALPFECIFSRCSADGSLSPHGEYISISEPDCVLLGVKKAETGGGSIVRLWNAARDERKPEITFSGVQILDCSRASLQETHIEDHQLSFTDETVSLSLSAGELATLKVRFASSRG